MAEPLDNTWTLALEKLRAATAGEFVIGDELGRGGFAAVFLAYDVRLSRRVAVKVMSPTLATEKDMVQRFVDEAVMMANLRHPNIITVYSVRDIEGLHCFIMEFVAGRSLEQILRHVTALPLRTAQAVLWQVGSALAYAHRRGVVHRDIKPANILMDGDGNALVTDFGIAKAAESSVHTQTGMLIGTPAYMSPEQCYGDAVTAASDQYSLGVVAYELFTGQRPFSGSNFAVMQAHTLHAVPPPREVRPDLPETIEQCVLRMLAKAPSQRFPSIREALAALGATPVEEGNPLRAEMAQLATLGSAPMAAQQALTPAEAGRTSAPTVPLSPVMLSVTEPPSHVEVGDSFRLEAFVWGEDDTLLSHVPITWQVSDSAFALVDARGEVTALRPGEVTITAMAATLSEQVGVRISPCGVAGIDVHLPTGPIRVGERVKLSATPRDKHSTPVPCAVTWGSENQTVAVLNTAGLLTAIAPGEATVVAEVAGVRGTARVSILPPLVEAVRLDAPPRSITEGETIPLRAIVVDSAGRALTDHVIVWSVNPPSVARISEDGGLTALAAGSATITAESDGKIAVSRVTVVPRPVASIIISEVPQRLVVGTTFRLDAATLDTRGVAVDRPVQWRCSDRKVARVSAQGDVSLTRTGRAIITAALDGVEASTELLVSPRLDAIDPGPSHEDAADRLKRRRNVALVGGAGVALVAALSAILLKPRDSSNQGETHNVPPPAHSSADVSAQPAASAIAPSPKTPANVGAVAVVVVNPRRGSIVVGDSIALDGRLIGGDSAERGRAVTWRSQTPGIASVSPQGVVHGLTPGGATVVATVGDRADTAHVIITAAPVRVAQIGITPARVLLRPNDVVTLQATPTDDRQNPLANRPVTWRSSDPRVIRIDPSSGAATATGIGQAALTATTEGVSASVVAEVANPAQAAALSDRSKADVSKTDVSKTDVSKTDVPKGDTTRTAPPTAPKFLSLSLGGAASCGLLEGSGLACWGSGQRTPVSVGGRQFSRLSVGRAHRCGIALGVAYCWGANNDGQLGDNSATARVAPTPVSAPVQFTEIAAGGSHTCALDAAGSAYCWGANDMGQLGDGSTHASRVPVKVKGSLAFRSIATGKAHTCALTADGHAFCWGDGWSGALGNGIKAAQSEPFPVDGSLTFRQLATGDEHSCALASTGKAYCWGDNRKGQDGDARTTERTKPSEVARVPAFVMITVGAYHSCGLTESNRVFCWGANDAGQLGDGSTAAQRVPVEVKSEERFVGLAAGASHTCAISRQGLVFCWGDDSQGQLGDGGTTPQTAPVSVHPKS